MSSGSRPLFPLALAERKAARSGAGALDRWLLAKVARGLRGAAVRLALWDGTEVPCGPPPAVGRIVFHDRGSLWRVAFDPDLQLGETYSRGGLDVEGDLVAAIETVNRAVPPASERVTRHGHSLLRSRRNVRHHYDLGDDFYRLWLDAELVYTCAYFPSPGVGLEEAQRAKMEHVCRKLALRPGERVVEAGCGWGALALHMARRHGARVVAFNVSRKQVDHARRRAAEEGLSGSVEFVEDDYRSIRGRFDVFVSVGMLEHVGLENYQVFGTVIDRCLGPDGRGLLHFIGRDRPAPLNAWIRRRIFPGAYPPTLAQVASGVFGSGRFSVLDVENLRRHYARTLEHWRGRFDAAFGEVEARFGRAFARAWRLYLAGSEAAFRAGTMQLFQVTFARGGSDRTPWTRRGLDIPAGP